MGPILSQLNPPCILKLSLSNVDLTLILSSHERLFLPAGLFPSGFPTKILHAFPRSRL
jgi:hypothetical protein